MCSALDEVNSRYYLPDLPATDATAVANIAERLFIDVSSSIYPAPSGLSCQGVVSAVRFCYSNIREFINLGTERRIFTLLILESLSGPQFNVTGTIDVHSTPTDQICSQREFTTTIGGFEIISTHYYCCDISALDLMTAFAITNERGLLRFIDNDNMIQVDHYRTFTQLHEGVVYTPNEDDRRSSQPLKLFQFFISKQSPSI